MAVSTAPLDAGTPVSAPARRQPTVAAVWALAAGAWVALWAWGASGAAYLLDHERLGSVGLGAAAGLMAGWVLMTMAMMLPLSMPLIRSVHGATARRGAPAVLALLAGYLGAWALFGAVVHAGDWLLHLATGGVPWLGAAGWAAGPVALVLAGAYQFTPLKHRCLARCCALPAVEARGREFRHHPARRAFVLGVREGAWTVGCCWALMLLMIVAGMGHILHMLALGAVMLAEKRMGLDHALTVPLGVTLVALGFAFLALGGSA